MSNKFSSFIKKKFIGKGRNLISLEEPYAVIKDILSGREITGIIDAGASDGRISRRLLKKFPDAKAYAFEPNPLYREKLEAFADMDSRFNPQFAALSDKEGIAKLHITASPGNTSLCQPGERLKQIDSAGSAVEKIEDVEVITIDKWCENNGNLNIELMKFDIQGHELKAFKGAERTLKNSTLLVYTEIWFNSPYKDGALYSEIDILLREYGFVLYDIYKPKYNNEGLVMWANAIFVNANKLDI
jgi:FkbM family methyltransferase